MLSGIAKTIQGADRASGFVAPASGARRWVCGWLRAGVVVVAAGAFAAWFNSRQLAAVSLQFRGEVPAAAQLPTLVETFLLMVSLYAAVRLTAAPAMRRVVHGGPLAVRAGLFVASIVLAIVVNPLWGMTGLVAGLILLGIFEFCRIAEPDDYRHVRDEYGVPFVIIVAAQWLFLSSLSPAYLAHAVTRAATTYLADSSTAMAAYVNAYSFSFSNFYHGFWGAAENVPTGLSSFVVEVFGFLHLFPLWEASSFFKSLALGFFAMFVVAGYFFYLMMRAAGISRTVACAAGSVYALGNNFFLNAASLQDGAWYVTQYVVLPVALFALAKAFRTGSLLAAAWAGMALAAQLYLMAPHPEATIYSILIFAVLVIAYFLVGERRRRCPRRQVVIISLVSGAAFTLGAVGYLGLVAYLELTRTFDIVGNTISVQTDYTLPIPSYSFVVVGLAATAEIFREIRYRRPNWVMLGFLIIAGVSFLFGVPGVARALMAVTQHDFGWSIHLFPADRFLTWLGLATIVIAAFGVDACLVFFARSRWWQGVLAKGGHLRMTCLHGAMSGAAFLFLFVLMIAPTGSARARMVVDGKPQRIYESLGAALANSLAPADQAASIGYLRRRLIAFETMLSDNPAALAAAHDEYQKALRTMGATSAQALAREQVRPFASQVAGLIDRTYGALPDYEDIPQNIDAYLATLDDPYTRVMSILDASHQTAFLGAARNVKDAQNNNMMFDTRMTVGYPLVEGLYMYPLSQLGTFQHMVDMSATYSISSRRYSWLYFASDVFGDSDFRKLLNIAGVGAYLTLPEPEIERAVSAPGSGLRLLASPSGAERPQYLLIEDERAAATAYLARPVKAENTGAAAAATAATRAYYRLRIGEAAYRATLEPLLADLLQMPHRDDAIIGAAPTVDVAAEDVGPAQRGGHVAIDNIVGPRTGLRASCPDPICWLVYTMADLPGWEAYVDGVATPIARANYAFLAVAVPHGQHYVAFVYAPDIDTLAMLASLLILLVLLEWTWRRGRVANRHVTWASSRGEPRSEGGYHDNGGN